MASHGLHVIPLFTFSEPSSSPKNVRVSNMSSTSSITVRWQPIASEDENGILLGYQIVYRKVQESNMATRDEEDRKIIVKSWQHELTLTNLSPFAKFSIRVGSFTRIGDGPFSETLYAGQWLRIRQNEIFHDSSIGLFPLTQWSKEETDVGCINSLQGHEHKWALASGFSITSL